MKQNTKRLQKVKREGIALIAVLGFLSILILMAVAFLMNMRTERLVAESAKDDVRTRQLTRGALASAMDTVDRFLDTGLDLRVRMPQDYVVFESTNGAAPLENVHLIDGQVTNWLPRQFLPGGMFDARSIEENSAKWVLVNDPTTNRIIGRYAFLIMDCTGMMDANLTDYPVDRGGGTSITEVSSEYLPEVGGKLESQYLHNNRMNYGVFGTFQEILSLNDGIDNASGYNEQPALGLPFVNHLMPYSLCYDNGWWDGSQWTRTGSGGAPIDVRSWTEENAKAAFKDLYMPRYSAIQCEQMGRCAMDYMDSDDQPRGPGGVCDASVVSCEAFPMINEITARNRIEIVDTNLVHRVIISVELWYPFPGNVNNKTYFVTLPAAPEWIFRTLPSSYKLEPTVLGNPVPIINSAGTPFHVVEFTNEFRACATNYAAEKRLNNPRLRKIQVEVHEGTLAGPVVDRTVNQGDGNDLKLPLLEMNAGTQESLTPTWTAANDPRLNCAPADWSTPDVATMGKANANVLGFGLSANGDPEGTNMYVRNGSNLSCVAEFGFIPLSETQPWTTVDLFSEEGRELLARNRTRPITQKIFTNGLINPNSIYTNVLGAVFHDVPVEEYPGGPKVNLNSSLRDVMTADIVSSIYAGGTSSYDSAAGWVTTGAFMPGGTLMGAEYRLDPYCMNNTKKESIIRNSYQLFNANQQLFTIVVIAQSINDQGTMGAFDEDEDAISGEKRAVALVWRDPFPNSSGRHEMFVKLFKYLDE